MKPRRCPVTIKIQHATRKAAKLHVRRLAQEGDDGLEPYRCRWCGRWHVGHKMGAVRTLPKNARSHRQTR